MTKETSPDDVSDGELAAAARSGDRAAFDRLYATYASLIAQRLRRILGRTEDVEDVLQTTFLELYRTFDRYDASRPFGAWIHGISVRVAGTFLRTKRRRWWQTAHDDVDTLPPLPAQTPEDTAAATRDAQRIWAELEKLAPDKRIAFVLFEIEQNTIGEVAELMGTSPQTAWARVNSARERIHKRLAKGRQP